MESKISPKANKASSTPAKKTLPKYDIFALERSLLRQNNLSLDPLESRYEQSRNLSTNLDRLYYERDTNLLEIRKELNNITLNLNELRTRKELLLTELQLCEKEIFNYEQHFINNSKRCAELEHYYQQQIEPLLQSNDTIAYSLKAHDSVKSLLQTVQVFENKVSIALSHTINSTIKSPKNSNSNSYGNSVGNDKSSVTVITSTPNGMKVQQGGIPNKVSNTITNTANNSKSNSNNTVTVITQCLDSYINTESKCLLFLTNRCKSSQQKLIVLNKELSVFRDLSLKSNTAEVEIKVDKLTTELHEDMNAVTHLRQNIINNINTVMKVFPPSTITIPGNYSRGRPTSQVVAKGTDFLWL